MKSKIYWKKSGEQTDPFALPQRINKGLKEIARSHRNGTDQPDSLKYLWLFATDDGVHHNLGTFKNSERLSKEDWLNVIDESATYGAEWLVIYAGISLASIPEVWELCRWAQDSYDMKVGISLDDDNLSREDRRELLKLEWDKTFIIAKGPVLDRFRDLEKGGIRLCEATIGQEERDAHCAMPEGIACVGPDGRLFSCGLVLGENKYDLGHVHEQSLESVMSDGDLPHTVPLTYENHESGCDGCPPMMAARINHLLGENNPS